jgi:hypothetical protein
MALDGSQAALTAAASAGSMQEMKLKRLARPAPHTRAALSLWATWTVVLSCLPAPLTMSV